MRLSRAALLLCFVSFFFELAALGQISGELKGRVSDPAGNGIANAQVRLTETSTTIQQNTIATELRRLRLHQSEAGFLQP